jgi:hypothetical protein
MTSEYHILKFSDFFHCKANNVSPFLVTFLFGSTFLAALGAGAALGFAAAAGADASPATPNSKMVTS